MQNKSFCKALLQVNRDRHLATTQRWCSICTIYLKFFAVQLWSFYLSKLANATPLCRNPQETGL